MSVRSKTLFTIWVLMIELTIVTLLIRYSFGLVTASSVTQQPASKDKNGLDEADDIVPIAEFDTIAPIEPKQRAHRLAKGKRYNKSHGLYEMPLEYNEKGELIDLEVKPKSAHWTNNVPALPVSQSNVILIGRIADAQAYLSNDKTGVYSEFKIEIESLLKFDATTSPYEIVADRSGGAVRFPSGKVQRIYTFRGQRMPQVGHRYVLFIIRNAPEEDLTILTGYELREGKVVALDSLPPYTRDNGSGENDFLQLIRGKIEKKPS